jgi:hypothetical protein
MIAGATDDNLCVFGALLRSHRIVASAARIDAHDELKSAKTRLRILAAAGPSRRTPFSIAH